MKRDFPKYIQWVCIKVGRTYNQDLILFSQTLINLMNAFC